MTKSCYCCHKEFLTQPRKEERIFCNNCAKKIKREIHKLRRKEHPFAFWKWNTCTCSEVDDIVEKIQNEYTKKHN